MSTLAHTNHFISPLATPRVAKGPKYPTASEIRLFKDLLRKNANVLTRGTYTDSSERVKLLIEDVWI